MKKINRNYIDNASQLYTLSKYEVLSFCHGIIYGSDETLLNTEIGDSFKVFIISNIDLVSISDFADNVYDYCGKNDIDYILNYYDVLRVIPKKKGYIDLIESFSLMQTVIEEHHCGYEVQFDFVDDTLKGIRYKQVTVQKPEPFVRINWNKEDKVR